MSTSRRAYDLLRAFVNQEKEAFASRQNSFDGSAASELEEAIAKPWTIQKQTPAKGPTSLPAADPKGRARIVLGVAETDDFGAIHQRSFDEMRRLLFLDSQTREANRRRGVKCSWIAKIIS